MNLRVAPVVWVVVFLAVFVWSAIGPRDRATWALEVLPAAVGFALVVWCYFRYPLTSLVYFLILVHAVILMVGGHYTYAEVPLFDWFRDWFHWERNNYDKLGHLAQGFIPAIIAREVVIRFDVFSSRRWAAFFIICFCLAVSAFYELIEWWVALLSDEAAESFLGTQGYVWDTQSDMAWALSGAILALILLGRFHDRQLQTL
jgi:putative membrane protein